MMNTPRVEILTAAFTPMHDDSAVNYDGIDSLYHHTVSTGTQGVFINGTTGECMSLSADERKKVVEQWATCRTRNNNINFRIFVHVGSCNLYEAAAMAAHAQEHGADGVAMVATFYFKPQTIDDLIEQCAYVAAAAPNIPFYYYNIPALTGVSFPLNRVVALAASRIPNFAGLKNSFSDLVDYQQCLHDTKAKLAMYWGTDETFMMLYAAGNRHYVGSTYNYMSSIYYDMLNAYHAGDHEKVIALQGEANAIYKVLFTHHGVVAGKEVMRLIGVDCGPVRKPLRPLRKSDSIVLRTMLETTTFFERARHPVNL
jgi:N-acetylneuraminate lyase